MHCLRKSAFLAALLASNIALVFAVNCAPADDDGSPLTGSSQAGDFVTCTYQGAGPCTYFPVDGSFSSGASTCPPGLPQGDAAPGSSTSTTPTTTDSPASITTSQSASETEVTITSSSASTSETSVSSTPSTTATQPPPTTRTRTQTEDAPPNTSTTPTSTQASSMAIFTTSSPSVLTATTVIIVSALIGFPNLLSIAYTCLSV